MKRPERPSVRNSRRTDFPGRTIRTENGREGRTEYRITSEWDGQSLKAFLRAQGYSTGAMTVLNAAVAEQLLAYKAALDKELALGKSLEIAAMDCLKPIIRSIIDVVCFDGNGYTDEWKAEAARRGLDTETSVPEMIKTFTKPESVKLFTDLGIYSDKELEARN